MYRKLELVANLGSDPVARAAVRSNEQMAKEATTVAKEVQIIVPQALCLEWPRAEKRKKEKPCGEIRIYNVLPLLLPLPTLPTPFPTNRSSCFDIFV